MWKTLLCFETTTITLKNNQKNISKQAYNNLLKQAKLVTNGTLLNYALLKF